MLPTRNNLFIFHQYRISLTFVLVLCSQKLQAVSLSTLSIASSSSPSSSSLFHSGSLLMDHGPLVPSTVSGLLLPWNTDQSISWHPGLRWIIAFLSLTISSYVYFWKSWCLSLSISNYLMWHALFQVSRVDRRSCGSGTTWWCLIQLSCLLDPLTLHITCIRLSVNVTCKLWFVASVASVGNGSSGRTQAHMNELMWNINAYHFEMKANFCRCIPNNDCSFFCTWRLSRRPKHLWTLLTKSYQKNFDSPKNTQNIKKQIPAHCVQKRQSCISSPNAIRLPQHFCSLCSTAPWGSANCPIDGTVMAKWQKKNKEKKQTNSWNVFTLIVNSGFLYQGAVLLW